VPDLACDRPEPEERVIDRSAIPAARATSAEKGYWDSKINHLALLKETQALEISFPGCDHASSMKSAIHAAAARAGLRVNVRVRGSRIYAWIAGRRDQGRTHPPRAPIQCEVCGREIVRPTTGGSKQFVCAGTGQQMSDCQKIRRCSKKEDISIAEAIERFRKAQAQRAAKRRHDGVPEDAERVARKTLCGP
jgi:hypothetical protein